MAFTRGTPPPEDDPLPLRKRGDGTRLFSPDLVEQGWEKLWTAMPIYEMGDANSIREINIHFRSEEDVARFKALLDGHVWWPIGGQGSGWFGKKDEDYVRPIDLLWATQDKTLLPRYPVYIPSVGRWEDPRTARALDALGVPYRVVVEPAQRDDYARTIGAKRLLVLPEDYSKKNTGSIPARNFIWDHAVSEGHARHWVIDDNVEGFLRVHRNRRIAVDGPSIFCAAEDFTDRYENVAFSGFNYMYLIKERDETFPPFYLNTRVYSMILVNHAWDPPERWRGRYNEDTDICLRALKDGWCTILFNAFLGDKAPTLTMGGGNTDTVYATGDKRREFAESLVRQHPDVAKVVWRYERWHHEVDYSRFRSNRLVPREGIVYPRDPEYGMKMVKMRRRSRYPKPESLNGDREKGAAGRDQEGPAGGRQEGAVRAGGQAGVRRGQDRGLQRRRGHSSPPAWRPGP